MPGPGERPTPWVGTDDVEIVPNGEQTTHMGWDIEPSGLTDTLVRLSQDYQPLPIYITENGSAWDDVLEDGAVHDHPRIDYLEQHVAAIHDAIDRGVDVRGYFAWSLLDNFEWAFGYTRRFGLVHVDYGTQERVVKASGRHYAAIAAENGLA